jgi:hypothetical protein
MLPPEMPVDEAINNGCPPNDERWITMPHAAGSRRYPLAPALKSNGEKMLLFHIKKFRSIYLQGAPGQPKGNGIKDGFVRRPCVYAVVFWLPGSGHCAWGALLTLLLNFFMSSSFKLGNFRNV